MSEQSGYEPGIVERHNQAMRQAVSLHADRALARPMLDAIAAMTVEEREAAVAQAKARHEQRQREEQEYRERRRAEAEARHAAVLDAIVDPLAVALVAMHRPADGPYSWDECAGCPAEGGYDNDSPTMWPCDTFELAERMTAPSTPARDASDGGR